MERHGILMRFSVLKCSKGNKIIHRIANCVPDVWDVSITLHVDLTQFKYQHLLQNYDKLCQNCNDRY